MVRFLHLAKIITPPEVEKMQQFIFIFLKKNKNNFLASDNWEQDQKVGSVEQ